MASGPESFHLGPGIRRDERNKNLFGGVGQGFLAVLDHLAHLADALGALGLATLVTEHVGRAGGPSVDGGAHFALADAVTVTNVQGRSVPPMIVILM